jgi:hypothetical protein
MLIGLIVVGFNTAYAHDESASTPAREAPATRFETFVETSCSPCVRESYSVATLPITPLRAVGVGPAVSGVMARGGEVRIDVVRAYLLRNATKQMFAMRATLLLKAGEGQLYPISAGLLDESEITSLIAAVADITKATSHPAAHQLIPDMTEMEFRGTSVRVGTIRVNEAHVAYVQAENVRGSRPSTAFETTNVMFLPLSALPGLLNALAEVERRIQTLRAQ